MSVHVALVNSLINHLQKGGEALLAASLLSSEAVVGRDVLFAAAAGRTASEEDESSGEDEQDGGDEHAPDGSSPLSLVARLVDVVVDDAETSKVGSEDDNGNNEGDSGQHRADERQEGTGANGEEEADEGQSAANRMQNHDAGQGLGGVFASGGNIDVLVNLADEVGGVVTNHLLAAVIASAAVKIVSKLLL